MIERTKQLSVSILERISERKRTLSCGKTKINVTRNNGSVSMRITTTKTKVAGVSPKPIVIIVSATKVAGSYNVNQVQTNFMGENKFLKPTIDNMQDVLIKLINKEN